MARHTSGERAAICHHQLVVVPTRLDERIGWIVQDEVSSKCVVNGEEIAFAPGLFCNTTSKRLLPLYGHMASGVASLSACLPYEPRQAVCLQDLCQFASRSIAPDGTGA